MRQRLVILLSFIIFSISLSAQILTPATWSCNVSKKHPKLGDVLEVIFTVELDDTWYLYSNKQSYDLGPLPAAFVFEPHDSYKLIGELEAIGVKKKYDDVFEVNVNYFEKNAEFRQKVKVLDKALTIKGSYEYQLCTTVNGKCILGDDDFEFRIITN